LAGVEGGCQVDMSAGRMGSHPLGRGYRSMHYFGQPQASWRMAGPLADFSQHVRAPDLYLVVAEWVAITPRTPLPEGEDIRHAEASAFRTGAILAGSDPVALDTYCVRHLLMPLPGGRPDLYNLDDENSKVVRFLRYYRQVRGEGTLDLSLVSAV
jgi:hypothetical protein